MKPLSRLLLLLLFFLITAFSCSAQLAESLLKFPPPPSAVEYDTKAWQEFSSSTARFTILMPGQPVVKDESIETDAGSLKGQMYQLITSVAVYGINYSDLPFIVTDPNFAQKIFDGGLKQVLGMDKNNKLLSEENIDLNGNPGRRFKMETPHINSVINGKMYLVNQRWYMIIITTPKYQDAPKATVEFYESTISKFLDSFRVVDGNPSPDGANR